MPSRTLNFRTNWKFFCAFCLVCQLPFSNADAEDSITTFYIVRHAERQDNSADSDLSDVGIRRSVELHRVLRTVPFSAVYSTDFQRTRKTVEPIANAANLKIKLFPGDQSQEDWISSLPEIHKGKHVVIASHSGPADFNQSAAGIAQALAKQPVPAIKGNEYNKLLVVQIQDINGKVERVFHPRWFGPLERTHQLDVSGELENKNDISAVYSLGDFLLVGSDEEDNIQSLKRDGETSYKAQTAHSLSNDGELDIEGMTRICLLYTSPSPRE